MYPVRSSIDKMVKAIRGGYNAKCGKNIIVHSNRTVSLYNSDIFRKQEGYNDHYLFSLAGWNTTTTKGTINAIIKECFPYITSRVTCRGGVLKYGDMPINCRDWYNVDGEGAKYV